MPLLAPDIARQAADRADAAALLRGWSIEVTGRDRAAASVCRDSLPAGTQVYVAWVPGDAPQAVARTAAALSAAGFEPVPHVAARNIAGYRQLDDLLARLAGEAGATQAMVIGGDVSQPAGPYHASRDLLRTGLFQKHGIRGIGLACYPEPHRLVGAGPLTEALLAKLDHLRRAGLDAWLVSQFCFEAAPILRCVARLRALGITAPLRIGLAGPADRRTLWKYALHCGIGASIRALGTRVDAVANLLARDAPDGLLADLAAATRADPALGIEGVHIFSFGGVAGAAHWAEGISARG